MAVDPKSLVSSSITNGELNEDYLHSAQLYVVVYRAARPGFYPWSFKIHDKNRKTWATYEVRKSPIDEYPVRHVHDTDPGIPGLDERFFELASFPYARLPEVYEVCETARVPGVGGKRCSQAYVNHIVDCLKKTGIVGETQVNYLFCRLGRVDENEDDRWQI
ncbi:hypothetical protein ACHAPA_004046 [Fusarium lateritium]